MQILLQCVLLRTGFLVSLFGHLRHLFDAGVNFLVAHAQLLNANDLREHQVALGRQHGLIAHAGTESLDGLTGLLQETG